MDVDGVRLVEPARVGQLGPNLLRRDADEFDTLDELAKLASGICMYVLVPDQQEVSGDMRFFRP